MNDVTTSVLFLAFVGAACVFLVLWILVTWWMSRRRADLLRRVRPGDDSDPTILLNDLIDRRGRFGGWNRFYRSAQERIERTELRIDVPEAFAIILFCGVVLSAIVFFWRFESDEQWLAIPAFILGAMIPFLFFVWRQRAWRRRMQDQLPDTLFLVARSLRSGMSIDQSIQVIGEHGVAPLSREFSRMHRQLELGLGLPQVLQTMATRLNMVDFSVFSSVLSLHRLTGGNLPIIMDRLATTTREHNQVRAYYRTATALGRFGSTVIFCLLLVVSFYLAFYQRDLTYHYFETAAGLTMFGIAMALIGTGLVLLFFLVGRDE